MERLKIALSAALALMLLVLAWNSATRALRSDEERIRACLEEMARGFDAATVREAVGGLHDGFRDRETGVTRRELADGLRGLFLQSLTRGGTHYAVDLPPSEIDVRVDEATGEARVALRAVFYRLRGDEREVWWDARAILRFTQEGGEWGVAESTEVNHRDRGRW